MNVLENYTETISRIDKQAFYKKMREELHKSSTDFPKIDEHIEMVLSKAFEYYFFSLPEEVTTEFLVANVSRYKDSIRFVCPDITSNDLQKYVRKFRSLSAYAIFEILTTKMQCEMTNEDYDAIAQEIKDSQEGETSTHVLLGLIGEKINDAICDELLKFSADIPGFVKPTEDGSDDSMIGYKLNPHVLSEIHGRAKILGKELGLYSIAVEERLIELAHQNKDIDETFLISTIEAEFRKQQSTQPDLPGEYDFQHLSEDPGRSYLLNFQPKENNFTGSFVYEDQADEEDKKEVE